MVWKTTRWRIPAYKPNLLIVRMPSICRKITREYNICESSNDCSLSRRTLFEDKIPCSGSENQHVKGSKLEKLSGQQNISNFVPTFKYIMKQITKIKKKLNQGKKQRNVISGKPQQQTQNGQQAKKKVKNPNGKKLLALHIEEKNNLNVNERPVRKKKKTKKYECYEKKNGKSPEPELRPETNLLLALGLTPVKRKEESSKKNLNKMHIMEEGNENVTADAAEASSIQPEIPKKNAAAKSPEAFIPPDSLETLPKDYMPVSSLINGISSDRTQIPSKKSSMEVTDFKNDQDGLTTIQIFSTSSDVEIKRERDENNKSIEMEEGKEDEDENEKKNDKNVEPQDLTVTCAPSVEKVTRISHSEKNYSNNKVISISVEQCQTNMSSINSTSEDGNVDRMKKPKMIVNRKRSNKSTDSDDSYKGSCKRIKLPEIEQDEREKTVNEYVEKASECSLEELQMNTEKLQQEIHSLSALARAKELEWNDIIRVKKVKEEIYLRLVRKKQIMLLSMGNSGRMSDSFHWDYASDNRFSDFTINDEVTYNRVPPSVSPKPPTRLPCNLTITKSQSNSNQNLQRFLMQPQVASDCKSNASLMMVPIVPSNAIPISSTSSYFQRSHLGTPLKIPVPDREKLKTTNNRNAPVPILPKPNQNVNVNVSQGINGHSPPIGRQGPIVDVKSIIADYRQNHPEQVPRRGRRPKGQPSQNFAETMVSSGRGVLSMSSLALGSGAQVRTINSAPESVGGSSVQNSQDSISRPSSADSNRSLSNAPNEAQTSNSVSFKDVLVQFAKMSQNHHGGERRNLTASGKTSSSKAPPYPEVTLHPVLPTGEQSPPTPSSSLLHGILTKNNVSGTGKGENSARSTTFSPTLARLLTTPDRSSISTTITTALRSSNTSSSISRGSTGTVSITDLLSTSKSRNELTITPIISNLQPAKIKEDMGIVSDEDPDDSADRLVIDESEEHENRMGEEEETDGETVPECQGCHMKSALFVCAGCGNQWYCSRNCQVTAWDEHSEVCSG